MKLELGNRGRDGGGRGERGIDEFEKRREGKKKKKNENKMK